MGIMSWFKVNKPVEKMKHDIEDALDRLDCDELTPEQVADMIIENCDNDVNPLETIHGRLIAMSAIFAFLGIGFIAGRYLTGKR